MSGGRVKVQLGFAIKNHRAPGALMWYAYHEQAGRRVRVNM